MDDQSTNGISPGEAVDQTVRDNQAEAARIEVPEMGLAVEAIRALTEEVKALRDSLKQEPVKQPEPLAQKPDDETDSRRRVLRRDMMGASPEYADRKPEAKPDEQPKPMYRGIPPARELADAKPVQQQDRAMPSRQSMPPGPSPRASFNVQPAQQGPETGGLETVQRSSQVMQKTLIQVQGMLSQIVAVSHQTLAMFEAAEARMGRLESQVAQLSQLSRSMGSRSQRNGRV